MRETIADHVFKPGPDPEVRCLGIKLGKAPIPQYEAIVGIKQGKTFRYHLECSEQPLMRNLRRRLSARRRTLRCLRRALGVASVGYVLMQRHPPAAGYRSADRMRDASVAPFYQSDQRFASADGGAQLASNFFRRFRHWRDFIAVPKQLLERATSFHHVRRQGVHVDVALIAENKSGIGIVHADALRNVVDSEFELLFAASWRG